jgi:hypothetical protein
VRIQLRVSGGMLVVIYSKDEINQNKEKQSVSDYSGCAFHS